MRMAPAALRERSGKLCVELNYLGVYVWAAPGGTGRRACVWAGDLASCVPTLHYTPQGYMRSLLQQPWALQSKDLLSFLGLLSTSRDDTIGLGRDVVHVTMLREFVKVGRCVCVVRQCYSATVVDVYHTCGVHGASRLYGAMIKVVKYRV